jgi:maltoporin
MKTARILFITLLFASGALLFGCTIFPQNIQGAERDAILAYAEPTTDNVLNGYNSGDYALFSKNFDTVMLQAETEMVFQQTRSQILSKIGKYISRQTPSIVKQNNMVIVFYNARFEQEDGVTVRVVFQPDGEHKLTGLWFDSPKLRQE